MRLTHTVMAERLMQVEAYKIIEEVNQGAPQHPYKEANTSSLNHKQE